jgi:hypothetical protein
VDSSLKEYNIKRYTVFGLKKVAGHEKRDPPE